jgi:uncharacterized protein (DUF1330 family)
VFKRILLVIIIVIPIVFSLNTTLISLINSNDIFGETLTKISVKDIMSKVYSYTDRENSNSPRHIDTDTDIVNSSSGEMQYLPEIKAFMETGMEFETFQVNGWAKINEEFIDNEALKEMAKTIWSGLKMMGSIELVDTGDERYHIINGSYTDKERFVVDIILHSVNYGEDFSSRMATYAVLNIDSIEDPKTIKIYKEDFVKILENLGGKATITTCITGSLDGKIDGDKIEETIITILNKLESKIVDRVSDEHYISISAYSPKINESIIIGNDVLNINIATRYDSYTDRTYLWLGVPIIATQY